MGERVSIPPDQVIAALTDFTANTQAVTIHVAHGGILSTMPRVIIHRGTIDVSQLSRLADEGRGLTFFLGEQDLCQDGFVDPIKAEALAQQFARIVQGEYPGTEVAIHAGGERDTSRRAASAAVPEVLHWKLNQF